MDYVTRMTFLYYRQDVVQQGFDTWQTYETFLVEERHQVFTRHVVYNYDVARLSLEELFESRNPALTTHQVQNFALRIGHALGR